MNKKLIRITESDLRRIIKESVEKILKEERYGDFGGPDADPEDIYDWWPKRETDNEKVDRLYDERNG